MNDNGKIVYRFTPANQPQADAFASQATALLFDGPWGSGKTQLGASKALFVGCYYPNSCIVFLRKKRVDLKPTLWSKFKEVLAHIPDRAIVARNDTELYRKLSNGSEFFGLGLDSVGDVNKLASREYNFMVVEEATELIEDDFDSKIIRCLRLPGAKFLQVLLLCNPGSPSHFLYRRFIESPMPGYERIAAEMLDNLPPIYYEFIETVKGIQYRQYVKGEWVATEGLVYPFNPRKHLIDRFDIPSDWRRVNALDFGFDHPFVCHFWAVSPEDEWYLDKEIYHTRRIVSRHAEDILQICSQRGIPKPRVICDHDNEDEATLRSCKINTRKANKARLPGQQSVYAKFDDDKIFFFKDGLYEIDPRLVLEDQPYKTIMEFPYYMWANTQKEDMIKEGDDGMDTMRYAIHTDKMVRDITVDMLESARTRSEREGGTYKQAYERMEERLRQVSGLPPEHEKVKALLREVFRK
jgi:phage terminase large subunit